MKILILVLLTLLITSCSPKFYTPDTQNVPLIAAKGETNLTLSGNANQAQFQGAYGVTNGFAIKADAGLFIPPDLDNGNGGSGKFIEFGGGYFKPINNNFVFETYGLISFGSFENHLPSTVAENPQTKGDISANLFRYGLQPNFGYKAKYFSAAISSRIVMLNFKNIKGDLIYEGENMVNYLKNNSSVFLIEPAITIKGGFEKIKLQLQIGNSFNLSNSQFRQDKSFMTLGLNFSFK